MLRHLFLTFERPADKEWLCMRIHDLSSTLYHNQLSPRESKSGIKRIPNARRTSMMVLSGALLITSLIAKALLNRPASPVLGC